MLRGLPGCVLGGMSAVQSSPVRNDMRHVRFNALLTVERTWIESGKRALWCFDEDDHLHHIKYFVIRCQLAAAAGSIAMYVDRMLNRE